MRATILNHIVFPKKGLFPTKHRISLAMNGLTTWNSETFGRKGNYDDMPDSTAMFADKFIFGVVQARVVKLDSLTKNPFR